MGQIPPPLGQPAQHIISILKKNSPVLLAKKKKRITPAQEKWENNHFKEKVRVKTGMTNYLFQRNQQNKTKGLIQLHYVSFEDLISVTKYNQNSRLKSQTLKLHFWIQLYTKAKDSRDNLSLILKHILSQWKLFNTHISPLVTRQVLK